MAMYAVFLNTRELFFFVGSRIRVDIYNVGLTCASFTVGNMTCT